MKERQTGRPFIREMGNVYLEANIGFAERRERAKAKL